MATGTINMTQGKVGYTNSLNTSNGTDWEDVLSFTIVPNGTVIVYSSITWSSGRPTGIRVFYNNILQYQDENTANGGFNATPLLIKSFSECTIKIQSKIDYPTGIKKANACVIYLGNVL